MTLSATAYVVAGALIGLALGLSGYTFVYARGPSYFTDDPAACANCHVMFDQFNGWIKSSHRAVAVCNDCHTPDGVMAKFATKVRNGIRHAFAFSTGSFPDTIRITPYNRAVTEQACRKCHGDFVQAIDGAPWTGASPVACIRCHSSVGHL
jgi:cytochrome c nitrite reductase small subunit